MLTPQMRVHVCWFEKAKLKPGQPMANESDARLAVLARFPNAAFSKRGPALGQQGLQPGVIRPCDEMITATSDGTVVAEIWFTCA